MTKNLLAIAGVLFRGCKPIPHFAQSPNPDYRDFENQKSLEASPMDTIDIRFNNDELPQKGDWQHLYAAHNSWSIYRRSEGYGLELQPPGFSTPLWRVETNHDFSTATIHTQPQPTGVKAPDSGYYPLRYPLDQIFLMHHLGSRGSGILHCAGLIFNKQVFIFPGKSGAGKSTISQCLIKNEQFDILNDDRIIIRQHKDGFQAYGTPWPGEAKIAHNRHAPLGAILFLKQAATNHLEEISPKKAVEKLLPITSIPWYHRELLMDLFDFCEKLTAKIPCYNLHFTPDDTLSDYLGTTLAR